MKAERSADGYARTLKRLLTEIFDRRVHLCHSYDICDGSFGRNNTVNRSSKQLVMFRSRPLPRPTFPKYPDILLQDARTEPLLICSTVHPLRSF